MQRQSPVARNVRVRYTAATIVIETKPHTRLETLLFNARKISLWQGIAFGIALLCFYDGGGYAYGGNKVAAGPTLSFLRTFLPGGMHTYGYIELLLGIAVIYTIHDRPKGARWTMLAVFTYSILFSTAVAWGWHISGKITWGGPSKWFFVGWTALWLAAKAAQDSRVRNET